MEFFAPSDRPCPLCLPRSPAGACLADSCCAAPVAGDIWADDQLPLLVYAFHTAFTEAGLVRVPRAQVSTSPTLAERAAPPCGPLCPKVGSASFLLPAAMLPALLTLLRSLRLVAAGQRLRRRAGGAPRLFPRHDFGAVGGRGACARGGGPGQPGRGPRHGRARLEGPAPGGHAARRTRAHRSTGASKTGPLRVGHGGSLHKLRRP